MGVVCVALTPLGTYPTYIYMHGGGLLIKECKVKRERESQRVDKEKESFDGAHLYMWRAAYADDHQVK